MFPDLHRYWVLFTTLSAQRQAGMNGPQPISISDIYALSKMMGFEKSDDFEFILLAIPKMDQIYLSHTYKEKEKEAAKTKKATPQRPPRRRGRNG